MRLPPFPWTLDEHCVCGQYIHALIHRPLDNEAQRVSWWSRHIGDGHGRAPLPAKCEARIRAAAATVGPTRASER